MLDVITIRFTNKMNKELEQPIIEKELKEAIEEMATRKVPRLNGIALEFFMKFWLIIRQEYYKVVLEVIDKGKFPNGVTQRLIALLHKCEF